MDVSIKPGAKHLTVRIIEARISSRHRRHPRTGDCRLVTTLLDPHTVYFYGPPAVDATDTRPCVDPERASFTTALNTAREHIMHAAASSPTRSSTWSESSAPAS